MTAADIEARNFTYCSATYHEPLRWEKFLVPAVKVKEARAQAEAYALAQWSKPSRIHLYPRNYVVKARELFAARRFPVLG